MEIITMAMSYEKSLDCSQKSSIIKFGSSSHHRSYLGQIIESLWGFYNFTSELWIILYVLKEVL